MDKRVPDLRFPGFEGAWEEKTLEDFLTFKNGLNASKDSYGSGYKFINVLDIINNDYITYDKIIGSVNVSKDEFYKNIVEYGDILFQRSSETRKEVGQANVYLDKEKPATFGGFVIRGKKKSDYEPVFFNYLLKTPLARKEITSKSGGSTRYNVGQETLSTVKADFPTLPEQTRIASFLTAVDKRIALLQKKKEALEQYKKGVMQKLFTLDADGRPSLRFKDDNGRDYTAWEEKKLGEVATFFSGGTPNSSNKSYYSGDIPFIGSGKISDSSMEQFITSEAFKNSSAKMIEKGDLLFALYGATSGEVAIAKVNGAINQAVLCIRGSFDTVFLYNCLKFKKNKIVATYLQGGQGNLSAKIVKNLKLPQPFLPEQQKIASFLSSLDDSIEKAGAQIDASKEWKKGLLQKMFV